MLDPATIEEPAPEMFARLQQADETLSRIADRLRNMRDRVGSTEPQPGSKVADVGEPTTLLAWTDKVVHDAEESLELVNNLAKIV